MAKRIKRLRAQLAAAVAERDAARTALAMFRAERPSPSLARQPAEREAATRPASLDLARLRRDLEVRRVELHNASARYGAIVNKRGGSEAKSRSAAAGAALIDERARSFVAAEHELAAADAVAGRAIAGRQAEGAST